MNDCIPSIELYSDAKASTGRFGICGANGEPVWYGRFFEDDTDFTGEQSSGELSAARKAVWVASKAGSSVHLRLWVDAQWLTTLSGKAAVLAKDAQRLGIDLEIRWVRGSRNPADRLTTERGYQRWQDADLPSLACIKTAEAIAAEAQKIEKDAEDAREEAAWSGRPPVRVAPPPTEAEVAERKAQGAQEQGIGQLCSLHCLPGVPAPGAISQKRFKRALREAATAGKPLNEDTAAEIYATLEASQ